MDNIAAVIAWIKANLKDITDVCAYICLVASVIIKLTPTLNDDNRFLPFIKWIGKYLALDKYGKPEVK